MSNQTFFKTRREELRLTQRDIALALNITTSAVSAWETGPSTPRPQIWKQLAAVLKVDPKRIAMAVLDVTLTPAA